MEQFEDIIRQDLHQFLLSMKEVDERLRVGEHSSGMWLPECPDVEEKWEAIAKAYIPDGIKEFNDYPTASLGWMMYIGMAVAKYWDAEWEIYSKIDDLYAYMRDKRGYDSMDEYIREEVLLLRGSDYAALEKLTGECSSRVYNLLRHQSIEPGTKEAFNAYVSCLHLLYLFGTAMQLNRMGYHMTKMNGCGLALSIYSIIYMRIVGKGNPFDAYAHEFAPRTMNLMTGGPYSLCRNPMLVGIYLYDAGILVWLWSVLPLFIFLVEVILLTLQVKSEEKRLEKDFGQDYLEYKKRVGRYFTL